MRAALVCCIFRFHYLCQADVMLETPAHTEGLFQLKEIPQFSPEITVNPFGKGRK